MQIQNVPGHILVVFFFFFFPEGEREGFLEDVNLQVENWNMSTRSSVKRGQRKRKVCSKWQEGHASWFRKKRAWRVWRTKTHWGWLEHSLGEECVDSQGVSRATRRLRPGQGWWWFSGREEAWTRMEGEIWLSAGCCAVGRLQKGWGPGDCRGIPARHQGGLARQWQWESRTERDLGNFSDGSVVKNPPRNAKTKGLILDQET